MNTGRRSLVATLALSLVSWSLVSLFGVVSQVGAAEIDAASGDAFTPPKPDHVVVVTMENKGRKSVVDQSKAPYITALAEQGANMTESYGVTHPSQPNYIAMFYGDTHGFTDNDCGSLDAENLGTQLLAAGLTFTGYAESLPEPGFTGCEASSKKYRKKHVPWATSSKLPASTNQPFSAFPSDFSQLPTVSFVTPNMCHDMHDCSVGTGDTWLKDNLDDYAQWAKTHNSLLILTFDENGGGTINQITTVLVGEAVRPGRYAEPMTHYNLLRTLEDAYGLAPLGNAATAAALATIWKDSPLPVQDLVDGIINGGFENGFGGWATSGRTSLQDKTHNGFLAGAAGGDAPSGTPAAGDSIISQTIVAPPDNTRLSIWWRGDCRPGANQSAAGATIVLKANSDGAVSTLLPRTCSSRGWQRVSTSIKPGRAYTLRLITHDDGGTRRTVTYFDDVTLS